ncbi:MAG: Sterol desaturase/sphingolipid hydroxylase, fatty acid hydroxylase superfamily [Rhodospirillales bacterium]|nr:Sterol desaturase/sphingolipid hydroxylase, fatty acid hydroxylase superfamily [Rhodospirillales bacterium]
MDLAAVFAFLIEHPSTTQLALFAIIMISMWSIEHAVLAKSLRAKWRHTLFNALFIAPALPIQIVMMMLCAALAHWVEEHHWGVVQLLPNADNPFIRYGVMFVVLDFLDYLYHFSMHQVPGFWRFHLVHHTDEALDVSTTVREHPGETLIRNAFLMLWVLLTGASLEVLFLRQAVETAVNILSHTSFRLPPRPARILGWLFITPNLHQTHHHFERPATNCNFGDVFSIWDRLFGTFLELAAEDTVYGLDTHMAAEQARTIWPWNVAPLPGAVPSSLFDRVLITSETAPTVPSA